MTKRVAIYTRVSTSEGQTIDNQLRDLNLAAERMGWEIVAHYSDEGISGAKGRDRRPGLDAVLNAITRREFDMVAAWSVCRLGRSLQHLVSLSGDLNSKGVDLYLHVQAVDTSTPSGRAMFQMLGVFSEFERAMISERVKSSLARVRASGKVLGRKPLDPRKAKRIRESLQAAIDQRDRQSVEGRHRHRSLDQSRNGIGRSSMIENGGTTIENAGHIVNADGAHHCRPSVLRQRGMVRLMFRDRLPLLSGAPPSAEGGFPSIPRFPRAVGVVTLRQQAGGQAEAVRLARGLDALRIGRSTRCSPSHAATRQARIATVPVTAAGTGR